MSDTSIIEVMTVYNLLTFLPQFCAFLIDLTAAVFSGE